MAVKTRKQKASIKTESNISQFINNVFQKKYAVANKYLKAAINEKIKTRIEKAANQPLF